MWLSAKIVGTTPAPQKEGEERIKERKRLVFSALQFLLWFLQWEVAGKHPRFTFLSPHSNPLVSKLPSLLTCILSRGSCKVTCFTSIPYSLFSGKQPEVESTLEHMLPNPT